MYDNVDRIVVSQDDINRICDWGRSKGLLNVVSNSQYYAYPTKATPFPLNEVAIVVSEETSGLLYVKVYPDYVYFELTYFGKVYIKFKYDFALGQPITLKIFNKEQWKRPEEDYIMNAIAIFTVCSYYISEYREVVERVKFTRVNAPAKNRKGKKSSKKPIRVGRYYITAPDLTIDEPVVTEDDKRKYERHAESWTVRGFWRQYKNGNRVWVRETVKGTGRKEPKEYRV